MEFELLCHAQNCTPGMKCTPGIESVRVRIDRLPDLRLSLTYLVIGDIRNIKMPIMMAQERADDLWKTTCFELFLRAAGHQSYLEMNFSPSSRWAAYAFSDYREGRFNPQLVSIPRIDLQVSPEHLRMDVFVDLRDIVVEKQDLDWHAGLSAVIEGRDGLRSYWALCHPSDEPDFHHGDCFAVRLPAPAEG
jgi:hypothetical protein